MLWVAACRGQLKIQGFPVGIEQQVELQPAFAQMDGVSQAVRVIAPIRVVQLYSVPLDARLAEQVA